MKLFILFLLSLALVAQTGRTVVLTWVDTQNPTATTYSVYRAPGLCSGTPVFAKISTALAVKTFSDASVAPGLYCYTVTASLNSVESAQAVPAPVTVGPFTPTSISITVQ